jgi:hypothetical protein
MKIFWLIFLSVSLWGNIGSVMAIKGSAEIKRSDESFKARSGMDVEVKDEIVTGEKSRVQVMLNDDTVVTIGANSSFSFEEFSQDAQNEKIEMRANRGFFRSVTGKIGKLAPERFKVKTASATIGIRGTDFSGDISLDKEVFKCFEGGISVEFEGGVQDLDPGMMIEIVGTSFEVKEFDVKQAAEVLGKQDVKAVKSVAVEVLENVEIPTEVISDITSVIESEEQIIEEPLVEEPFELTPNSEDRPVKY